MEGQGIESCRVKREIIESKQLLPITYIRTNVHHDVSFAPSGTYPCLVQNPKKGPEDSLAGLHHNSDYFSCCSSRALRSKRKPPSLDTSSTGVQPSEVAFQFHAVPIVTWLQILPRGQVWGELTSAIPWASLQSGQVEVTLHPGFPRNHSALSQTVQGTAIVRFFI